MKHSYSIRVVGCHKEPAAKESCAVLVAALVEMGVEESQNICLTIEHDTENQYDPFALIVKFGDQKIGYVSKDTYFELWEDFTFAHPIQIAAKFTYIKWFDPETQIIQWLEVGFWK